MLALESDAASGRAVNLGSGPFSHESRTRLPALSAGLGLEDQRRSTLGSIGAGDIRHCFADTSLAAELLGFDLSTYAGGRNGRSRSMAGWSRSGGSHR